MSGTAIPATSALATAALLLGACASTRTPDFHGLEPANAALVDRTCHEVLGLRAGEAHFDGCAETLADSLRHASTMRAAPADDAAPPYRSYFRMSPTQKYERERLACARLGLDQASGLGAACVANLDSCLFGLDHPLD